MNRCEDITTILGIRILVEEQNYNGDYYVKHEFTGENWKQKAADILASFINRNDVKIQTLHPFSASYNAYTGGKKEPGNLWLDNQHITPENLE